MPLKTTHKILLTFVLALPLSAVATVSHIYFDHYTTKDGLSSNTVTALAQDTYGHIWVGTDFGLNRFDGTNFRHYLKTDYPTFFRNDVKRLGAISGGRVLMGGYNGLLLSYDFASDSISDVAPVDFSQTYYKGIVHFCEHKGQIFACTTNGVYTYDCMQKRFVNTSLLYKVTSPYNVRYLLVDRMDRFWIVSDNKLLVFSNRGKLVYSNTLSHNIGLFYVANLIQVSPSRIMFLGVTNNVNVYDIAADGNITLVKSIKTPFNNICQVAKDRKGRYWFATDGDGLWYSTNEPTSSASFVKVIPFNGKEDDFNKLYSVIEDNKGGLWVGSQNSGLWYARLDNSSGLFTSSSIGMNSCVATGFTQDKKGDLLFSADGMGVFSYNSHTASTSYYGLNDGLSNKNVTSMLSDAHANIWVTTWGGGLFRFDEASHRFRPVSYSGFASCENNLFSCCQMSNGELWVCAGGDGIYVNKPNGTWSKIVLKSDKYSADPDLWPYFVVEGKKGVAWAFTSSTIWLIKDGKTEPIQVHYQGSNAHDVVSINDAIFCSAGFLTATSHGLFLFSQDGKSFRHLDYMPTGVYSSVCADAKGRIWTSGSNGIIQVDLKRSKMSILPIDFSNKGQNYFVSRSSFVDSTNRIFFGNKEGFFSFDPHKLNRFSGLNYFAFSDLYLSGKLVRPGYGVLKGGRLANGGELKLNYDETNLQIDMDMVDFSDCKPRGIYRLKGLDNQWMDLPANHMLKFSYIPAGYYTLQVKVFSADHFSPAKTLELSVTVSPPWWSSWWFQLICIVTIIGFVCYKLYSLRNDKRILQQRVDERTQELSLKNHVIEQRNAELNKVLVYKDRLIAVVAHDLKNPMFAIVGALEGLLHKGAQMDNTQNRQVVQNVLTSAHTLQDEMIKLLNWATSGQDKIEFRPSNTDLEKIIREDISLLKASFDAKNIQFIAKIELKNFVYVDSRMVSTVIRSLINNAIKFTPSGKSIQLTVWQATTTAYVAVEDEGVGMSAQKVKELNCPGRHVSTQGTNNEVGTGLGLSIAQDYVAQNNGKLSIRSVEGKGSVFTLELPLAEEEIVSLAPVASTLPAFEVNTDLMEGNTILVVDDDPLICQNIQTMLEAYVNVLTAHNGQEALQLVQTNEVDVVLSDVEMPVMNGIAMSLALAADPRTNFIPIIFLSARTSEQDRLLGLQTGAIDYIPKPFSQNELLIKINNILSIRQKQQQRLLADRMQQIVSAPEEPSVHSEEEEVLTPPAQATEPEIINPLLTKMMEVIEKNYTHNDFSVERLADEMCMTKITLYRRIKTLLDKTPVEVLSEFRLNKAMQMLKETDKSVGDVAYEVGFSDPAYFTRRFRTFFGVAPSSVHK